MRVLVTSIVDLKKSQNNRLHHFIRYLSRNNEVSIISINDYWKGKQDNFDNYVKDFEDIYKNISYHYITDQKAGTLKQEFFSRGRIGRILKNNSYDVCLNYGTFVSGNYTGKKIKMVYDLADDNIAMVKETPQLPSILRPLGSKVARWTINNTIKNSEKVTLPTIHLKDVYKIPDEKCVIIPNGVDTTLFKNYSDVVKEELGLSGFVIGYVGVLREWIDFKPLFSALKEIKNDINVIIIGKEGNYAENVELARSMGLHDRVRFTGTIPYSLIPKYISAMDACIIPFKECSVSENAVPLKLFEYMACEKPVISSRLKGIESIVNNRILYANDKNGYKEAINTLYEDPKNRRMMGVEGRNFIKEKYSWQKVSEDLEKVLIDVYNN